MHRATAEADLGWERESSNWTDYGAIHRTNRAKTRDLSTPLDLVAPTPREQDAAVSRGEESVERRGKLARGGDGGPCGVRQVGGFKFHREQAGGDCVLKG